MKHLALLLLLLFSTACGAQQTLPVTPQAIPACIPNYSPMMPLPALEGPKIYELHREAKFQDYAIRVYLVSTKSNVEVVKGVLTVWKNDHIVCQQEGGRFYLGTGTTETGKAIIGNGVPNLLIEETTGAGDRCCTRYHIFELGQELQYITTTYTGWGYAEFKDLDNDSALEITLRDWTFAYWHTCFACSPFPKVILKFKDGLYQFASNLMQQPAPSLSEIEAYIQKVKPEWQLGYPPEKLWGYMLDLIYAGHADLAWQFFDQAWPTEVPGKTRFLAEFMSQLAASPYWFDLRKMNKFDGIEW